MRFVEDDGHREANEKIGAVDEKHVQNPVRKLWRQRVKGVYEHGDDPLVAHGGADVDAVLDVVGVQPGVLHLRYGRHAEQRNGQIGG